MEHEFQREISYEERLSGMSPELLLNELAIENGNLALLGVKTPISEMIVTAMQQGENYEGKKEADMYPTPMNCLMVLLHMEPNLRDLPLLRRSQDVERFEKLGRAVSHVSMIVNTLAIKEPRLTEWPDEFTQSPQRTIR